MVSETTMIYDYFNSKQINRLYIWYLGTDLLYCALSSENTTLLCPGHHVHSAKKIDFFSKIWAQKIFLNKTYKIVDVLMDKERNRCKIKATTVTHKRRRPPSEVPIPGC